MSLMALVDSETLDVYYYYYTSGGIPGDINDHCVRVPVPDGVDYTTAKAVKATDGSISIVADPVKVADKQWVQVRERRQQLLSACDWTQLADSHLSDEKKAAWADYRQALRDIPEDFTDPTQVQWPDDPTTAPVTAPSGSRADGMLSQV
jgi:hypothetical protein